MLPWKHHIQCTVHKLLYLRLLYDRLVMCECCCGRSEEEKAETGLLSVVLALIMLKEGSIQEGERHALRGEGGEMDQGRGGGMEERREGGRSDVGRKEGERSVNV